MPGQEILTPGLGIVRGIRYPAETMAILVDGNTKVLCQGITGATGAFEESESVHRKPVFGEPNV